VIESKDTALLVNHLYMFRFPDIRRVVTHLIEQRTLHSLHI